MQKLKILNSKEIKRIKENCIEQFGGFLSGDYAFLQNEKDKIAIVNKDLVKIDLSKLNINKLGLYFAEATTGNLRLSKEGAQLLYLEAKQKKLKLKNVVELNKEELRQYFQGENLERDLGEENKFVLLAYQDYVFGCAKYKEKKIINFQPKIHRGEIIL